MDKAYRFDELAATYGNFSLQGSTFETGKAMTLSVLPARQDQVVMPLLKRTRETGFLRRKSLDGREEAVTNALENSD